MSDFRPGRSPARPAGGKRSVPSLARQRAERQQREVEATDAARALADQNAVDLATVEHEGEQVTQADVNTALEADHVEPELEPVSTKVTEAETLRAPVTEPPVTKTTLP